MRTTEASVELDAEFDVGTVDGQAAFTMHSHGGASGGRPRRNPQYGDALRVILQRLAERDVQMTDALVVSSDALRDWPAPEDRRLKRDIRFPIRIADHDVGQLRTALTEAMRATARDPSLGPGGNNRRRVTFFLEVPGNPPIAELAAYLASGTPVDLSLAAPDEHRGVPLTVGAAERRSSRAQGYVADAAYRRAVELRAMQVAVEHYEDNWVVEDTSAGNPYDLVLRRDGQIRYIEVKGTAGLGEQVNLTANEVSHADHHAGRVVLFVVHGIDVDRTDPAAPIATGGTTRILDPLDLAAGELRPTTFTWGLPRRRVQRPTAER